MTTSGNEGSKRQIIVIGAGVIGTCCACYLQREGFKVTLIERDGPGEGCSSGNAGNLGTGSCVPLSMPGTLMKVPGMLFDPTHPLSIRWHHFPRAAPWFVRFSLAGRRWRVEEIADALNSLQRQLLPAYDTLLAAAGGRDLVQRGGKLFVYESRQAMAGDGYAMDIRRRRGIELRELSGDEIRELEPALGPRIACGIFMDKTGHTVNPLRLVQVLAEHFVRGGGRLLGETVTGIEMAAGGGGAVVTGDGRHPFDLLVVAAGAWSRSMAARLGTRVPLEVQDGYHVMMPRPGVTIRTPVLACERKVILSTMEHGLRVTGIAEFAGLDAPPDYRRAEVLLDHARDLVPGLGIEGMTRWRGQRPVTPDSLPVIGRSPRHPSVLFAFGHGHLGMGLGAITGKLIAEIAAERPTSVDITPFRPNRFRW